MPAGVVAQARIDSFYIAVNTGVVAPSEVDYRYAGIDRYFVTKYDKGLDLAAELGYQTESLRIGVEARVRRAEAKEFGFDILNQPQGVATGDAVNGSIRVLSGALNLQYDLSTARIAPFVGGGIGVTRFTSSQIGYARVGPSGIYLDGSDTTLAFHATAGVRAQVTERFSATLAYRHDTTRDINLRIFQSNGRTRLRTSALSLGLIYALRAPPPPPPPLPVPVQPAAGEEAPIVVEMPETGHVATFAPSSTVLDAAAARALDSVVVAYGAMGYASIMIMGSDWQAPAPYDEMLALLRAEQVRAGLISRGVPPAEIVVQQFDPLDPLAPKIASPSVPSAGNATKGSVDITFGPGSGR